MPLREGDRAAVRDPYWAQERPEPFLASDKKERQLAIYETDQKHKAAHIVIVIHIFTLALACFWLRLSFLSEVRSFSVAVHQKFAIT